MTTENDSTGSDSETLQDDGVEAPMEDKRLKDPKVLAAVIDVLDAIQAANEREITKRGTVIETTALRVIDLRDLITAAIAEPGTIPTDSLLREASELSDVAPARDMQPIWELLTKLEEVQPTLPPPTDVAIWAENLCYVSINMKPWEHMEPGPNALYHAGLSLLENEPASLEIKLGHLLMLDALVASPEAAQHVVRHLRTLLAGSDPRLAMFTR